jgi:hypothetical protein
MSIVRGPLQNSPMSFRYWIPMDSSQKRYIKKYMFGAPSSRGIRRPNENLGTYWHLRNRSSYSDVICSRCSTVNFEKESKVQTRRWTRAADRFGTKPIELWVYNAKCIVGVYCDRVCNMRIALWVYIAIGCVIRKAMWDGTHVGVSGNDDNSDTRVGERKIGALFQQCNV